MACFKADGSQNLDPYPIRHGYGSPRVRIYPYPCHSLDVSFDTRGQRDHHQVNCQGVLTLQYSNGAIPLMKDDQGQYVCNCAHPNCPKPFKSKRGLQKHIKHAAQPWNDTPKVIVPDLSQNHGELNNSSAQRMPTKVLMQTCQQYLPKRPQPSLLVAKSTMPHEPLNGESVVRLSLLSTCDRLGYTSLQMPVGLHIASGQEGRLGHTLRTGKVCICLNQRHGLEANIIGIGHDNTWWPTTYNNYRSVFSYIGRSHNRD